MTKSQIDQIFIESVLPLIKAEYEQDGRKDIPARCEAYNNYIDGLHKDDVITNFQVRSYCIPKHLIK